MYRYEPLGGHDADEARGGGDWDPARDRRHLRGEKSYKYL
jgi:hypothetical protein